MKLDSSYEKYKSEQNWSSDSQRNVWKNNKEEGRTLTSILWYFREF